MIRRRLLTGTISNVAGRFTTAGLWFLLTPLMLNRLEPSGYALWAVMGALGWYGSLLDLGIGGAVTKYVAEHVARGERENVATILASAQWVYLGLAGVTMGLSLLLAPILPDALGIDAGTRSMATWLVMLTGAYLAIMIAFSPSAALLRGLHRHDVYNAVDMAGSVVLAAATVAALLLGWGVVGVIAMNIPVNLAMGIMRNYACARVAPHLPLGWRGATPAAMRRIASFGSSMFITDVATCVRTRSDVFIIAISLPLAAVTPYSLARRLGEVTEMAALQFAKVVLPLASELDAGQQVDKLRELYIVGTRVAIAAAAPLAVVLGVLGGPILTLWVGAEYATHAPLVTLLAVASVLATTQAPAAKILQGIGRQGIVAATSLIGAAATIVFSLLLLWAYGLQGVALGALIPTALACFCVVMPVTQRSLGVAWSTALRKIWLPGVLPAVAAAAMLSALQLNDAAPSTIELAGWIVAAVLVYGGCYLSMPATAAERELLSDFTIAISHGARQRSAAFARRLG